jgi:hypothetical protein
MRKCAWKTILKLTRYASIYRELKSLTRGFKFYADLFTGRKHHIPGRQVAKHNTASPGAKPPTQGNEEADHRIQPILVSLLRLWKQACFSAPGGDFAALERLGLASAGIGHLAPVVHSERFSLRIIFHPLHPAEAFRRDGREGCGREYLDEIQAELSGPSGLRIFDRAKTFQEWPNRRVGAEHTDPSLIAGLHTSPNPRHQRSGSPFYGSTTGRIGHNCWLIERDQSDTRQRADLLYEDERLIERNQVRSMPGDSLIAIDTHRAYGARGLLIVRPSTVEANVDVHDQRHLLFGDSSAMTHTWQPSDGNDRESKPVERSADRSHKRAILTTSQK